eukprot:804419-Rhodomonas_salina.2
MRDGGGNVILNYDPNKVCREKHAEKKKTCNINAGSNASHALVKCIIYSGDVLCVRLVGLCREDVERAAQQRGGGDLMCCFPKSNASCLQDVGGPVPCIALRSFCCALCNARC